MQYTVIFVSNTLPMEMYYTVTRIQLYVQYLILFKFHTKNSRVLHVLLPEFHCNLLQFPLYNPFLFLRSSIDQ